MHAWMSYFQELLFADQQLIAQEKTARYVRDFAKVMVKMSNLNVLTGSRVGVRLKCSLPKFSSS